MPKEKPNFFYYAKSVIVELEDSKSGLLGAL